MSLTTIGWVAGLLEGEAHFHWNNSPYIRLAMTDADIVAHVGKLTGYDPTTYFPKQPNRKQVWVVNIGGTRAVAWMMTIYPLMGARRRAKITDILQQWKNAPGFPRGKNGTRIFAICHPDRPRAARGLCESCYHRFRNPRAQCHPNRRMKEDGLCAICIRWKLHPPPILSDIPCHPDRPHFCLGFCKPCYGRYYHYHYRRQQPIQLEEELMPVRPIE
jgi:hypothetical protein